MTLAFEVDQQIYPFPDMQLLEISDSSLNGAYRKCARKLEFRKFYSVPGENKSLPGEVGHCLHEGWQEFIVSNDREKAIAAMMFRYPIDLCSEPSNYRSIEACYATLNKMMDSTHLLEYEIAEIKCLDGETRPAVEVPFLIKVKNFSLSDDVDIPVHYIGFIDVIIRHRIDGTFIAPDIKTTRDNIDDATAKYLFDEQTMPYQMVLERILGHELESFFTWYYHVYVDLRKPHVKLYKFPKNKYDIRDWARGFYSDLLTIKKQFNDGWFPRNGKSCMNFKRPCDFFEICNQRNQNVIERWIEGNFTDPPKRRDTTPWIEVELELTA